MLKLLTTINEETRNTMRTIHAVTPPAPRIPQDIIAKTAAKYQEAWDRLTS